MRVLLVHPPAVSLLGLMRMALMEPLALERLAAALPDDEVTLLDMRIDPDLEASLQRVKPQLVGITCPFTIQANVVIALAARVKQVCPDALILTGGHHPSLRPQDFAQSDFDAIVRGEGEQTLAELVQCLRDGGDLKTIPGLVINRDGAQHITPARAPIADLDELPLPARHLTAQWRKHYYWMDGRRVAIMETSRGCPHHCNYCSVWRFHEGTMRFQSPERIVREIAAVDEHWIAFCDDNFLMDVGRARRTAELIAESGIKKRYSFQARTDTIATHPELIEQWRDVGLSMVLMGLDKTTDDDLADLRKKNSAKSNEAAIEILRDLGLFFIGNFIADPQWDAQDFAGLRDYLRRRGLFRSSFTILTPLPATPLFDEFEGQLTTREWEQFDLCHSVVPTKLPLEEFYREYAGLWRSVLPPATTPLMYIWLLRELWGAFGVGVGLRHLRRILRVYQIMSNPATYLRQSEELL